MVFSSLMVGAGIGFVAGVSPGPVLTLVVAETLRGGWLRGAAIAAGPLLADGPIIALAILVVGQLSPDLVKALSFLGGGFLLYLAVSVYLNSRSARLEIREQPSPRRGLLKGVLARALSPNPYLFWFLVGAPLLAQASEEYWLAGPAFLIGYYSTIVGSNVALSLALWRWIDLFSERIYRSVLLAASMLLGAYGVAFLGRGISSER